MGRKSTLRRIDLDHPIDGGAPVRLEGPPSATVDTSQSIFMVRSSPNALGFFFPTTFTLDRLEGLKPISLIALIMICAC